MAFNEGLRLSCTDNDRYVLRRYRRFLADRYHVDLPSAGWEELRTYRTQLLGERLKTNTIGHYVGVIRRYYLLRARQIGDAHALDNYAKMRFIGKSLRRNTRGEGYAPFSRPTLVRILEAARSYDKIWSSHHLVDSEDWVFIMTLLYTGGRSAFYGLRVSDLDFTLQEIRTRVKGGVPLVLPLHPRLAEILGRHLATRKYRSQYVFRNGGDLTTLEGQLANRANALCACKRVRRAAGLKEPVHPYRFRRTFAVMSRELGLTVQQVQAILGHSSILTTYNVYAKPRIDEVRHAFSKIDLLRSSRGSHHSVEQLIAALQGLAPPGKQEAWATLVQGFAELFGGSRMLEPAIGAGELWATRLRYKW